jgi:enamine deaminase RidA (YjgF/YER057c/UK114 family)
MRIRALFLALLAAGSASAQTTPPAPAQPRGPVPPYETPRRIPSSGGEVLITHPGEQRAYDEIRFAPARRVGDTLYISGVIVAVPPGAPAGPEELKAATRRTFRLIERLLKAAGSSFADVAMLNTFHVWTSPHFAGTRDEHFAAFSAVKDEFMPPPHPAWTAVGTNGLLADTGLVEVQVIAHVPAQAPARRGR